ncbi:hypothetical protein [Bacillus massiliglaciei]|uniref:hypothetical protein n=1 Tax=Bacillus massiliglaciei TaxID=1816693 RepID=UPI000DA636B5|nr:hypothetical protein [Bacillus massiliglaciei]
MKIKPRRTRPRPLLLLIPLVAAPLLIYGGYQYAKQVASDKLVDSLTSEMANSEELDQIARSLEKDPELTKLLEEQEADTEIAPDRANIEAEQADSPPAAEETAVNREAETKAETKAKEDLPFETKEEAAETVIKKVGLKKLGQMKMDVENGSMSKQEAMQELKSELSEEEVTALKVIALKEMEKRK